MKRVRIGTPSRSSVIPKRDNYPILPALGMVGAALGGVLAFALTPERIAPAGAVREPAIVLSVGLLLAPLAACLTRFRAMFRIENVAICGLVFWLLLDLIQGLYDLEDVTRDAVASAFLAIGLFAGCLWAGTYLGRAIQLPPVVWGLAHQDFSASTLFTIIVTAFGLAFLRFAIPSGFDPLVMIDGLTRSRFSAPWSRGGMGGWDAFLDHLAYFGYLLPCLTVMLAHRLGKVSDSRVIASIVMSIVIALFLMQGGGRRILGMMAGSALMCWVLLQPPEKTGRVIFVPFAAVVVLLVVMQAMLLWRSRGSESHVIESMEASGGFRVDDNFLRLSQLIQWFPERVPFVEEKYVVWVLVRPIPRVFWPGKPMTPGFEHGEAVGNRGTSLTSSVIGEAFMSLGWFAVIAIGLAYGAAASTVSQVLIVSTKPSRLMMYGLGSMALFVGLRSMIEVILMGYTLLAWIGLALVMRPAQSVPRMRARRA